MKIDANLMIRYLDRASLSGRIHMLHLDFTEDSLKTAVRDQLDSCLTVCEMKKEAFTDYEPLGELFIRDTQSLIRALKSFSGMVTLAREEDHLLSISSDQREAYIVLASDTLVDNKARKTEWDIDWKATVKLRKSEIANVIKDMEKADSTRTYIELQDGILKFTVGEKKVTDYFVNKIEVDTDASDISVTVGEPFVALYKTVDDEFSMDLATDKPIRVFMDVEDDYMSFKCLIAPINEAQ